MGEKWRYFRTTGIALLLLGIGLTAFLGALTNLVNAFLSPEYFTLVMRLSFEATPWFAVRQGIFEGSLYSLILSSLIIVSCGKSSCWKAQFGSVLRYILFALAGALIFWIIGGIVGVTLSLLVPHILVDRIFVFATRIEDLMSFSWVAGSIQGIVLGGIISTFVVTKRFQKQWLKNNPVKTVAEKDIPIVHADSLLDQNVIISSISNHMDSLTKTINWYLVVTFIFLWAGLNHESEISALSIKIQRYQALTVACGYYIAMNMHVFHMFLRLANLVEVLDSEHLIEGLSVLSTHHWSFNPFSYFGATVRSRWHSCLGYGFLIIIWWHSLQTS